MGKRCFQDDSVAQPHLPLAMRLRQRLQHLTAKSPGQLRTLLSSRLMLTFRIGLTQTVRLVQHGELLVASSRRYGLMLMHVHSWRKHAGQGQPR